MGKEMDIEEVREVLGKSLALSNNNNKIVRDLPLLSLNHVSYVCKSVRKSVQFYEQVLGFVLIQRPSSFDFEGAWLFNHGIGIHLLEAENKAEKEGKLKINPKDNHISFQCTDMELLIHQLEEKGIEYVKAVVREGGIIVDQIFFHDPDGYMIEICNCQNLPVLPLSSASCPLRNKMQIPNIDPSLHRGNNQCSGEVEALMMENLAMDMLNLSI
ncbi:lactoylglutathione lyase [Phtheirospermum japonicum]|uniref:Lactoylglutathione lyase n=1 Tax=Phtheirospermum japonicum TaxID=374723 RepID=A0A830D5F5_9LAMI|nr:lactoylglutathione lyase [Phtheirospermum japonicum]